MLKYFVQWIKEEGYKILIPFFIVLIILIMVILPWLKEKEEKEEETKDTLQSSLSTPQVSSSITVVPKEKPSDPDLKVSQKYVAQINNKTVEIPLSKPKETLSPDGQTVVVSQTVDMTAAVKPILPRWSVGVGVGRYHSETYIPLSVTRHYKPLKRSLQVTLKYSIDKGKISGGEVQHLWNF